MSKYLNVIVTSIILISSQAFAELIVTSPIDMKFGHDSFRGMSRYKLDTKSKLISGKWKCVGEAGFKHFQSYTSVEGSTKKIANCSIDQLDFTNDSLKLTKSSKEFVLNHVFNFPWIIEAHLNATENLYNNFYGDLPTKDGKMINLTLYDSNDVKKTGFFLTDCTSFDNKLLVCKTKGGYTDYACDDDFEDTMLCNKEYVEKLKNSDMWSVFARESDTNEYRITSDEIFRE